MKNTYYLALAATLTLVAVCTAAEEAALHGVPLKGQDLLAAAELPVGAKREVPFSGLSVPPGRELVLALKARLDSPRPAGYTRGMRLTVNGQTLDGARLVNWEREEPRVNGELMSPAAGETFNVPYSPDFDAPNKHPSYALRSGPKLCRYELRVTDLVRDSDNRLIIENSASAELNKTLVIADVRLEVREPVAARPKRPAPTGPLPVIRPASQHKVDYRLVRQEDGTIEIGVGGATFRVEAEFSTPEPAWVRGPNQYFDHRQDIQQHDEWIVVRDTFINRTAENLPLVHRHRVTGESSWKKVWLAWYVPIGVRTLPSLGRGPSSTPIRSSAKHRNRSEKSSGAWGFASRVPGAAGWTPSTTASGSALEPGCWTTIGPISAPGSVRPRPGSARPARR